MTEVAAAALILSGLTFGPSFGRAAFALVDALLFVIPVVAAFAVFQALDRPAGREW